MNSSLIEKLEALREEAKKGHWTLEQVYGTLKEHGITLPSGELNLDDMARVSGGRDSGVDDMFRAILEYSKFVDSIHKYEEGHRVGYDKSWAVYFVREQIHHPQVLDEALKKIDEIWSRKN